MASRVSASSSIIKTVALVALMPLVSPLVCHICGRLLNNRDNSSNP